eukprot:2431485-Alexandrium_andersonii.AAC.1
MVRHLPQWDCQRSAPLAHCCADKDCCWPNPIHLTSRRAIPTRAPPCGRPSTGARLPTQRARPVHNCADVAAPLNTDW